MWDTKARSLSLSDEVAGDGEDLLGFGWIWLMNGDGSGTVRFEPSAPHPASAPSRREQMLWLDSEQCAESGACGSGAEASGGRFVPRAVLMDLKPGTGLKDISSGPIGYPSRRFRMVAHLAKRAELKLNANAQTYRISHVFFHLELGDDCDFDALRKKSSRSRSVDHEMKKGVPWTEDGTTNNVEFTIMKCRQFLLCLLKHGKGDWRSILRNFVASKTPTQVASAQKYFLRLNSGLKDERRPSIHDITTTNLTNTQTDDSRVA
ncbi:hypothetical protein QQ045_024693 [Rhodiola kirilowii]